MATASRGRKSRRSGGIEQQSRKKSSRKAAFSLSKNTGVVKGRLPLKLYSGSDGMHVRTDEKPEVFVPCDFCRPGAGGKTRENSKKWRSATFLTLSKPALL